MNWKLRLKNKTTLLTLCTTIIAFVYALLSIFGVVPKIEQETVLNLITMAITALATLGILVDPTTDGIGDSKQAMGYDEPKKDGE